MIIFHHLRSKVVPCCAILGLSIMGWTCRNLPSFPFVCRGPSVAVAERPGEPFWLPGSMKRCQVSAWALLEYQPSVGSQLSDKRLIRWWFLHPFTTHVEETHGEAPTYLSRTKYINRVSWLFSSWLYLRSQQLVPSKLSIVLGRNVMKHCQAIGFIVFIYVSMPMFLFVLATVLQDLVRFLPEVHSQGCSTPEVNHGHKGGNGSFYLFN